MKVAIVGCGFGSSLHVPAVNAFDKRSLIAVCDTNANKADSFAHRYRVANVYSDFDAMLQEQKPDVVHIVTPPKTHASLAMKAINNHCHVLVEKPMTTTADDAQLLIEAARANKVKLCVMHNHLFDPPILQANQIISKTILGNVLYIDIKYNLEKTKMITEGNNDPDHWIHQLPLGVFGEHGLPHIGYLLLSFLGSAASVQVCAKQLTSLNDSVNSIALQLKSETAIAHAAMFDNTQHGHFTVLIHGTKATLNINMLNLTMSIERERKLPKTAARMFATIDQSFQSLFHTGKNIINISVGKLSRRPGHRALIRKFYDSILANRDSPVTGEEGKKVVELLQTVEKRLQSAT